MNQSYDFRLRRPLPQHPLLRLVGRVARVVVRPPRRRRPNPRLIDQLSRHLQRDIGLGP